MNTTLPVIERHGRFDVVRDDLLPGGTKSRYLGTLFEDAAEVVYASPAQGAAQIALAFVAKALGKSACIYVARRATMHANTEAARSLGARIQQVSPGYLTVVQARARQYVKQGESLGASVALAPFGLRIPEAVACLREACSSIHDQYDEVWCAAGSGTLASALGLAFPSAKIFAVSIGHRIKGDEAGRAKVLGYDRPFGRPARVEPPFPCNMTFDAKAWEVMTNTSIGKRVLFWNVDKQW